MKRIPALCLTLALCICQFAPPLLASGEGVGAISTFDQVRANFVDPPAEYRTMPFWVWNTEIKKEDIDRQLQDYKSMGFGGIFVHPRYGLITEYLSQQWFDLVRYSVTKGKELGIEVWLYDENSFPSGFAGGHVPAQMPESFNQGQGLQMVRRTTVSESEGEDAFLILKGEEEGGFRPVGYSASDPLPEGDYRLFQKRVYESGKWYAGFSYVDLIHPGVTEKFIEVTMEGYEKSIGDEFGRTVPGIFTDEPHLHPPSGRNLLRWTPTLFDDFQKRWGYDLRPHLPSLLEEVGEWQKVRHNYYKLLLELFIERWSKPWYDYTEAKGLKWTGHYWEHEWPRPIQGPDNMAMYAWHQLPAIDMLFNTFDFGVNAQFGNVRAVKELSSIANQYGRRRTLSETYGAAGWELRFEDMKRLGDWQYALGVNFMNQHLSYMTLAGDRKHDFPQSFSEHEPWWPLYRRQAEYFARLSLALAAGEQINSALVIEPTSSAWIYFSPSGSNYRFDEVANAFQEFTVEAERRQFEYDLGSEQILELVGSVTGDRLVVGQREYSVVILPPGLDNLNHSTTALLRTYLENGGRVLTFVDPPKRIDGEVSSEAADLARKYASQWTRLGSIRQAGFSHFDSMAFVVPNAGGVKGLLFHHRRVLEEGQLIFLVNSSLDETTVGTAEIAGRSLQELDPKSGVLSAYPGKQKGSAIEFSFSIPPAGSLLLYAGTAEVAASPEEPAVEWTPVNGTGPLTTRRLDPNVLILDYCDLEMDGMTMEGAYYYSAANAIWRKHGFDDNPWVSSSQYKTGILDRASSFEPGSGFKATFPFRIEPGTETEELRLVVERPNLWKVEVNGHAVDPTRGEWWLDREFGVFLIGRLIEEGLNTISVSTSPMCIHCELEPVYLLGNFGLSPADEGWTVGPAASLKLGDWRAQGLPFYAHRISYVRDYMISQADRRHKVRLEKWHGSVAEIRVNGENAGLIESRPYELDVTEWVKSGKNQIEVVVYGSLKNLLGPHHNVSQVGIVTPWSFKFAPAVQPPGTEYDGESYGLKAPFELLASK